jgi:hypothetical protein
MSRWLPRPLEGTRNIVGGKFYIRVCVDCAGGMTLVVMKVNGVPNKENGIKRLFWEKTIEIFDDGFSYNTPSSAGDMGLLKCKHNNHRMFEYNLKTYRFLKHMVNKNLLSGYLLLINSKDNASDLVIRGRQTMMRELDEMDRDFGPDFNVQDHRTIIVNNITA